MDKKKEVIEMAYRPNDYREGCRVAERCKEHKTNNEQTRSPAYSDGSKIGDKIKRLGGDKK